MTLTLTYPVAGRIGPGVLWYITSSLIGPIVPGTTIFVELQDTTTHTSRIGMSGPVNNVTMSGTFGCPQNYYTLSGGGVGLPDGDPVEIRAFWLVPGSGIVDNTVFSGFSWDASSMLWLANYFNLLFAASLPGSDSSKINQILASVRTTYSTP